MKKCVLFMAAACLLSACSSAYDEEEIVTNDEQDVTLTFSPYDQEPMTRTATSIAGIVTSLDVWITDGEETTTIHQSSSDNGFGSITVTLNKQKSYSLYAVGHKCATAATLTDGVISFPDDKVTHSMFYKASFTPASTTSLSCLMNRIVANFRLEITDDFPSECSALRFTIEDVFDRWHVNTGGTHSLNRVSTITYNGSSSIFNVYAIVTSENTLHNITIDALEANNNVLQTRELTDVPLRNGYKTNYRGQFFVEQPVASSFIVDDWNDTSVVNF